MAVGIYVPCDSVPVVHLLINIICFLITPTYVHDINVTPEYSPDICNSEAVYYY